MRRNIDTGNKGFSLLEMTVVIIILTILASAAIPVLTRAYVEKAGTKTALDISAIQEAARSFYINNGTWPGTISGNPMGELTAGNYLPSSWSAINPFGVSSVTPSNFSYNISSNAATLTVGTNVPVAAQPIIQNLLPTNWVAGNTIYSTVTVPGGIIASFGQPIPVSSGAIYYANTDGFLEGNAYTFWQLIGFSVYSDSSPNPGTLLPECNQGTFSTNNGGYALQVMVHCLIHKGNYYRFNYNGQSPSGYTVNFVPLNS